MTTSPLPLGFRFYDAWNDKKISDPNTPSKDVTVLADQLTKLRQSLGCSGHSEAIKILEVRTRSGRVIRELYKAFSRTGGPWQSDYHPENGMEVKQFYCLIRTETNDLWGKARELMCELQKVQGKACVGGQDDRQLSRRIWRGLTANLFGGQRKAKSVQGEQIEVSWKLASSNNFVDGLAKDEDGRLECRDDDEANVSNAAVPDVTPRRVTDLICFVAGEVWQIASLQEVRDFISRLWSDLNSQGGRAVILIVHGNDQSTDDSRVESGLPQITAQVREDDVKETPQCAPDGDLSGKVFVKFPTVEQWERLGLALEDARVKDEAREKLCWQHDCC